MKRRAWKLGLTYVAYCDLVAWRASVAYILSPKTEFDAVPLAPLRVRVMIIA